MKYFDKWLSAQRVPILFTFVLRQGSRDIAWAGLKLPAVRVSQPPKFGEGGCASSQPTQRAVCSSCTCYSMVLLWKSTGSVPVPLEPYQPLSRVSVHSRDANRGRDETGLAIRGPGSAGGEAVSIGQAGKRCC